MKRQDARRALGIKTASYMAYCGVALGFTVSIPFAALLVGWAAAVVAWFQLTPEAPVRSHDKTSTAVALVVLILATSIPQTTTFGSGGYERQADALSEPGSGLHTGVVLLTTAKPESQLTAPPTPKASGCRPGCARPSAEHPLHRRVLDLLLAAAPARRRSVP